MADKSKAPHEAAESGLIATTIENIFLPEIIKKAVVAGLKSVIGTEEGVRSLASAAIPRDALNYLLQQIDNSKNEILRIVSREIRVFLEQVNIGSEIQKILTSLTFEIKTEIRFTPNDSGSIPSPEVKTSISTSKSVKRKRD